MKKKKIFLIFGVIVVIFIGISSVIKKSGNVVEVETQKVVKGKIAPTVICDGVIAAKVTVNIQSQVIGDIVDLPFKEGERVKKGDLLVQINPDTYKRDVASAQANYDSALVALKEAEINFEKKRKDLERIEKIYKDGIVSLDQYETTKLLYEQAELQKKQAKAAVEQSKAVLDRAKDYLAKTRILSPIDGIITALNAKVGETAIMGTMNFAGTVILTVSDLSEIITEVQVDEADFPKLKMGQNAEIVIDALSQEKYKGKVIEIGASAHSSTTGLQTNIRQFTVKVAIENPDEKLKPGMTARVKLFADQKENVIIVPIGAVKSEVNEKEQVYYCLVEEKGRVKKAFVKTGLSDDLNIEIVEGLKENENVITGPYRVFKTLKEGDKVKATSSLKKED